MNPPLLAIIPARGGSRGVRRKNMRSLGSKPLIAHTLDAIVESGMADRLVLSSDDPEILGWARLHGHETMERPAELASDEATIADVAAWIADELDWQGVVGVFQPTSPLRSASSVCAAIEHFRANRGASLMSVAREEHLFWLDADDDLSAASPLFTARVNRQYAKHRVLRETGAIQLVDALHLRSNRTMVSDSHLLFELPRDEVLDIDTIDDLEAGRRRLEQATVVFRLRANAIVGSGHLYHCLQLAEELADQQIRFLLVDCDPFVSALLDELGHEHRVEIDMEKDLRDLCSDGTGPQVVVNDVLDTSVAEIMIQRAAGFLVVNVEDLGPGAHHAHLVVNALYPLDHDGPAHSLTGSRWATLRSAFRYLPPKEIRDQPQRVLVTFGGTDPSQLAPRISSALCEGLADPLEVNVVVGPGAPATQFHPDVRVRTDVRDMANEMMDADVIITSAGRTVYEAAATGTPVVVLAQNAREATHAHLGYEQGVLFLGVGALVSDEEIVSLVRRLLDNPTLRSELSTRLRRSIDHLGAERIATRIRMLARGL